MKHYLYQNIIDAIKAINNYFQMEKFMHISILLFINAVFIFQPTKSGSYQSCSKQTAGLCSHICDRSETGCCDGGEEDTSWKGSTRTDPVTGISNVISDFPEYQDIQYNQCSGGQCTVNGVLVLEMANSSIDTRNASILPRNLII